jgi:hypothetical protein
MERGMTGNCHVPCGAGEKLEITSNAYLLLTNLQQEINYFYSRRKRKEKNILFPFPIINDSLPMHQVRPHMKDNQCDFHRLLFLHTTVYRHYNYNTGHKVQQHDQIRGQ